jgi:hypothetical protein
MTPEQLAELSPKELYEYGYYHPEEALASPSLPLLGLEDPAWYRLIVPYWRVRVLRYRIWQTGQQNELLFVHNWPGGGTHQLPRVTAQGLNTELAHPTVFQSGVDWRRLDNDVRFWRLSDLKLEADNPAKWVNEPVMEEISEYDTYSRAYARWEI